MLKTIFVLPGGTELSSGTGTINAIQSVTITECVNGAQDLTLGSVCANMIEAKIITPEGGLSIAAGDEITVYRVDDAGRRYKVGLFTMEKPTRDNPNRLSITAYDRVIRLDKDLSTWLKGLTGSYTLLKFAQAVCTQCGLQLVNTTLPNGNYIVPRFTKSGVTGRQLMKWIGEACGRFCRATADGKIEFAWYTPVDMSIGPREIATANLTVDSDGEVIIDSKSVNVIDDGKGDVTINSEALSIADDGQGNAELTALSSANQLPYFQGSLSFEDYQVAKIDAVQLSLADGQDGYLWPEAAAGANSYIISGNPLLNRAADDMRPVVQTILDQIKETTYTPCKISIPSNMNIHAGNIVQITDSNGKTLTAYVMTKKQTGQKDTVECTGNHRRDSTTAQNNKSVEQIAQQKVDAQTQADVFNKLTDGGKLQGLYIQDGKLYINAEFVKILNLVASNITSGILSSKDSETFYLDLEKGILKMKATEFSIAGKSLSEVAKDSVQIGGTNILLNSEPTETVSPWFGANETKVTAVTIEDKKCISVDPDTSTISEGYVTQNFTSDGSGVYTLSAQVYVKSAGRETIVVIWRKTSSGWVAVGRKQFNCTAGWNSISATFEGVIGEEGFVAGIGAVKGGVFYVYHPKLEDGNKATSWSPAPSDVESYSDKAAANAVKTQTQEDVFNKLTDGGKAKGIYLQDGELYINASYLKSGVIDASLIKAGILQSSDGTVLVDLINNKVTINTNDSSGYKGKIELTASGIIGYGWDSDIKALVKTLRILPGRQGGGGAALTTISSADSYGGISIAGPSVLLGNPSGDLLLRGNVIIIDGKQVSWKDNGDGTYTLIGT